MVNNSKLKDPSVLKFLPYQAKINLYDRNCAKCSSASIKVRVGRIKYKMATLQDAIDYSIERPESSILRECSSDSGYTFDEIINNSCGLWGIGEDTVEIEELPTEDLNDFVNGRTREAL